MLAEAMGDLAVLKPWGVAGGGGGVLGRRVIRVRWGESSLFKNPLGVTFKHTQDLTSSPPSLLPFRSKPPSPVQWPPGISLFLPWPAPVSPHRRPEPSVPLRSSPRTRITRGKLESYLSPPKGVLNLLPLLYWAK